MKVVIIFSIFLALPALTILAQTVDVKKEDTRIGGENVSGYQVAIAATEVEVKSSLVRYLRAMGKTKVSGDYITMAEPVIGGKKYSEVLHAATRQTGITTSAWIGVLPAGREDSGLDKDLQKLVYDFGVTFQREKIQLQIDESRRALQAVERQQARLVSQNKDLINKIESNKRQKVQLEQSLVQNKIDLEDLTKKLEANVKAQDSVSIATGQIKRVVEMHKEKQKNVN